MKFNFFNPIVLCIGFFIILLILLLIFYLFTPLLLNITRISNSKVMNNTQFTEAINNNDFLKKEKKTINSSPLDQHEEKIIRDALKYEKKNYGGKFDQERDIEQFTGNTLVVGGGKKAGKYGENQGKCVLIDYTAEEKEIRELIENLRTGKWNENPYTGEKFNTKEEKEDYLKKLEHKQRLYQEAFEQRNKDILRRDYTLNIMEDVDPDMIGSITSESDMSKVPDGKFTHIEFENVPCDVFINPKLYPILERITKPNGTIKLSISYACHRLIVPVIQATKFGEEFTEKLKTQMYNNLEGMHPTYNVDITVTNKK